MCGKVGGGGGQRQDVVSATCFPVATWGHGAECIQHVVGGVYKTPLKAEGTSQKALIPEANR